MIINRKQNNNKTTKIYCKHVGRKWPQQILKQNEFMLYF